MRTIVVGVSPAKRRERKKEKREGKEKRERERRWGTSLLSSIHRRQTSQDERWDDRAKSDGQWKQKKETQVVVSLSPSLFLPQLSTVLTRLFRVHMHTRTGVSGKHGRPALNLKLRNKFCQSQQKSFWGQSKKKSSVAAYEHAPEKKR